MSDGDRHNRLPDSLGALLWLAVAILFVVLVFALGSQLGVNSGRDEITAHEHYDRIKKNELSACVGMNGSAARKCIVDAIEASQQQSDARQDLYAQQDMAKWAFWLLVVSVATVAATVVGIYYVRRNLEAALLAVKSADDAVVESAKATHEATESNRIARKQLGLSYKPWLDVSMTGPYVPDEFRGQIAPKPGTTHIDIKASISIRNISSVHAVI